VRIVLDTNVVMSALLWRGKPYQLLEAVRHGPRFVLYSSGVLLEELADVLTRPSAAKRLALIDKQAHEVLLDYIAAVEIVAAPALPQPVCRDPDDDAVLALALSASADLIVSGDNDLLVLEQFEGVPIVNATQALALVAPAG
jgi:putative PIN family toxin of toxin-antitoxin system